MKKNFILLFICLVNLTCNYCLAQDYIYETKLKPKMYCKDFLRGKAQITFRKKYKALCKNQTPQDIETLENIHKYRQLEMENAFKHAFVSAKMTYIFGDKIALKAGYKKELKSYDTEIKNFGGKVPAFLDTNCDLWNGEIGVNYALEGKKTRKSFKLVGQQIFENMTNPNSDFIIDYKNDPRRWEEDSTPDNILEFIEKRNYGLKNSK